MTAALADLRRYKHFYLFIAPFFVIFAVFGLYPLLFSLYLSFVKWDGLTAMQWVGLSNFHKMLEDDLLWRSLQNTAIIGRLIAQGQSENLFTDVDPLEAAYLLRGMIGAAIRFRRIACKEDDMRDHADIIMRVFLKGLLR